MKVGDYKTAKTRDIIEDTISQLCAVGFKPDGAAALMVVQGMIRIEDRQKRKDMAAFAVEMAEDPIDE